MELAEAEHGFARFLESRNLDAAFAATTLDRSRRRARPQVPFFRSVMRAGRVAAQRTCLAQPRVARPEGGGCIETGRNRRRAWRRWRAGRPSVGRYVLFELDAISGAVVCPLTVPFGRPATRYTPRRRTGSRSRS